MAFNSKQFRVLIDSSFDLPQFIIDNSLESFQLKHVVLEYVNSTITVDSSPDPTYRLFFEEETI